MKMKRGIFIGTLLVLFLCCYHIMNQHYDELSRYQYANDDNRKLILEYMTTDDINYLIDRQYKPEEFLGYLNMPYFNIRNVDWYNTAKNVENIDPSLMLKLVDTMKNQMTYAEFRSYCQYYSLSQLNSFFLEENAFVHELKLISDPTLILKKIPANKTLFTYEPKDLIEIEGVPIVNQLQGKETVQLQKKAGEELMMMCRAAFEMNEKTCGNMVVTQGYLSFDEQEKMYEDALLTYGIDDALKYVSYPGQSIYQLGNVIRLVPAAVEKEKRDELDISIQQQWLMEHADEYGFEFVNDPSHPLDEFILQYHENLKANETDERGDDIE